MKRTPELQKIIDQAIVKIELAYTQGYIDGMYKAQDIYSPKEKNG